MGIAGGVRNLQWLFTATFVVMLAAVPVFGAVVARAAAPALHSAGLPFLRRQHRDLLAAADASTSARCTSRACSSSGSACSTCSRCRCSGRSWPTCFASEQGKRLFGFIAAGGSAGALLGPALTVWLAVPLGPVNLLIVAALLLELRGAVRAPAGVAAPQSDARDRGAGPRRRRGAAEPRGAGRRLARRHRDGAALALPRRHRAVGGAAVARRNVPLFPAGEHRRRGLRRSGGAHAHLRHHRSRHRRS